MIINFTSADGRYDDVYLSNYAMIYIKDELFRVSGVSDITFLGQRNYSIRAWLDPQKLASRNMTAGDVANAIRSQNLATAIGQLGQPPADAGQSFQVPMTTLGRLTTPEEFGNIIIKVSQNRVNNPRLRPRPRSVPLAWRCPARSARCRTSALGEGSGADREQQHRRRDQLQHRFRQHQPRRRQYRRLERYARFSSCHRQPRGAAAPAAVHQGVAVARWPAARPVVVAARPAAPRAAQAIARPARRPRARRPDPRR